MLWILGRMAQHKYIGQLEDYEDKAVTCEGSRW